MLDFKSLDAALEISAHAFALRRNLALDIVYQFTQTRLRLSTVAFEGGEFLAQSGQQVLELFATHGVSAPEMGLR